MRVSAGGIACKISKATQLPNRIEALPRFYYGVQLLRKDIYLMGLRALKQPTSAISLKDQKRTESPTEPPESLEF